MAEHRKTVSPQPASSLLRDGESQMRFVGGKGPVAIAYCDTEGRYRFVNKHYAERHGLTPEQVIGKHIQEVVCQQAWRTFEPYFRQCLGVQVIEFELEIDLTYRP